MSGTLYICGTPIGNLEDMTMRSLRILNEADYIACEDTRRTLQLANYFEINTKGKLISYHEHNKLEKGIEIVNLLNNDKTVALVTDAGMPCISDPGYDIVKLCYEHNLPVTTVPGPTAVISGLILSGLSTRAYIYDGFLPVNNKKRGELLKSYELETRSIVLYEAPHHIKKTLQEIGKHIPDRQVRVIREITKKFEEVLSGTCTTLVEYFEANEPRGEMVIVIDGIAESIVTEINLSKWDNISIENHMKIYTDTGLSQKDAMKKVAKDRNVGKSVIYKQIQNNQEEI